MKRVVDVVGSSIGLIILSPILVLIALVVRSTMGAPIFFVQWRPGLRGQPFRLMKFRTMHTPDESANKTAPDAMRITRVGHFLRSWSLDELPELWNVLRGDMSLVGPRPLLVEYLARYTPGQARRHDMRPGITGWAQVNGRNAISWEERFALDVWYVDNQSAWLDLYILLITVWRVIRRSGINAPHHVSMPPFEGA